MSYKLTPRMIELIDEAYSHVGRYVIVKMDKTGMYRVDSVEKAAVTMDTKGVTTDLLTMNSFVVRYSPYSRTYESRKEAEDVAMQLNSRKGEGNE